MKVETFVTFKKNTKLCSDLINSIWHYLFAVASITSLCASDESFTDVSYIHAADLEEINDKTWYAVDVNTFRKKGAKGPFSGIVKFTRPSGYYGEFQLVEGKISGTIKEWSKKGKLTLESNWMSGFPHGVTTFKNNDGKELAKLFFSDGELDSNETKIRFFQKISEKINLDTLSIFDKMKILSFGYDLVTDRDIYQIKDLMKLNEEYSKLSNNLPNSEIKFYRFLSDYVNKEYYNNYFLNLDYHNINKISIWDISSLWYEARRIRGKKDLKKFQEIYEKFLFLSNQKYGHCGIITNFYKSIFASEYSSEYDLDRISIKIFKEILNCNKNENYKKNKVSFFNEYILPRMFVEYEYNKESNYIENNEIRELLDAEYYSTVYANLRLTRIYTSMDDLPNTIKHCEAAMSDPYFEEELRANENWMIAEILFGAGDFYIRNTEFERALHCVEKSLEYYQNSFFDYLNNHFIDEHNKGSFEKSKEYFIRCNDMLGVINSYLGRHEIALKYSESALNYSIEYDFPELQSIIYSNKGLIYYNNNELYLSKNYIKKSIEIEESDGFYPLSQYRILSSLLIKEKDFKEAKYYAEKCISESEDLNVSIGVARGLINKGVIEHSIGNHDIALSCFHKSKEYLLEIFDDDHPDIANINFILAYYSLISNDLNNLLEYANDSRDSLEKYTKKVFSYASKGTYKKVKILNPISLLICAGKYKQGVLYSSNLKCLSAEVVLRMENEIKSVIDVHEVDDQIVRLGEKFLNVYESDFNRITEDTALLEFVKYDDINSTSMLEIFDYVMSRTHNYENFSNTRYGCFVVTRRNDELSWSFYDIGDASSVESIISKFLKQPGATPSVSNCKLLYEKLISRIAKDLNGFSKLVICPDSELNFVPFSSLISDKNNFFCEEFELFVVSSLKDYLLDVPKLPRNNTAVLFGNPDFTYEARSFEMNSSELDYISMRSLSFEELPGSALEIKTIRDILTENGFSTVSYIDKNASEHNLRTVDSPTILHLATHGFYLKPDGKKVSNRVSSLLSSRDISSQEEILGLSGLLLSGAKFSLYELEKSNSINPLNDGIISSYEACYLPLKGNWLTVLSACDSGVGLAKAGDGVVGLKRSLFMAGAQNLLLTLWPVEDKFTSDFMVSFYKEALKTKNAPKSFAKVQKEWLIKLREERSIGQAVKMAGPFILTFRGNPALN